MSVCYKGWKTHRNKRPFHVNEFLITKKNSIDKQGLHGTM